MSNSPDWKFILILSFAGKISRAEWKWCTWWILGQTKRENERMKLQKKELIDTWPAVLPGSQGCFCHICDGVVWTLDAPGACFCLSLNLWTWRQRAEFTDSPQSQWGFNLTESSETEGWKPESSTLTAAVWKRPPLRSRSASPHTFCPFFRPDQLWGGEWMNQFIGSYSEKVTRTLLLSS